MELEAEEDEEEEYLFIKSLTERNDNDSALTQQGDCYAGQHYELHIYMDLYSAMSYRHRALRHGSHSFTSKLHHACFDSPAAEHHRPLAGTHFTIPRRLEG